MGLWKRLECCLFSSDVSSFIVKTYVRLSFGPNNRSLEMDGVRAVKSNSRTDGI